jgi:secondary thiamine-phosphate synthase enzyme
MLSFMRAYPAESQTVHTRQRAEMINITGAIDKLVQAKKIRHGMAIVCITHTTAAVTINENTDSGVQHDLLKKLEELIPKDEAYYEHQEGNSDSHLKASLVGNSVTLLIEAGRLILGQWQAVYMCEFDGPRQREMVVKLVDFE